MYNFSKEFAKFDSVNFWRRRSPLRTGPATLCIDGGHDERYRALKPEHVIRLMTKGIKEAPAFAKELGCKNVHLAKFYIEHDTVYLDNDYYNPYEGYDGGADCYYLIAEEK